MSLIRSRDTKPEKIVRRFLAKRGIKYRLYLKKLPGKPDIVISKENKVIFINGCFWHQHKGCRKRAMPKTNTKYWREKLRNNVKKQMKDIAALKRLGWKVRTIWECEIKNPKELRKKLQRILT